MKAKIKRPIDNSHAQFKAAGIQKGVVLQKGAWQEAKDKKPPSGTPKRNSRSSNGGGCDPVPTSQSTINKAALAKAGGQSWEQVAQSTGITKEYVANKVREKFINNRQGREVLKSTLLENGIAFAAQAGDKIEELNGMQSVVAAGIMTQRFIDLDRHTQNIPDTIDLEEVAATGRAIQELEGYITVTPSDEIPDDIITLE